MEVYTILWTAHASRSLRSLDRSLQRRILKAVEGLGLEPLEKGQRLTATPALRVRVGDYRVVFLVARQTHEVVILEVAHRRAVYR